MNEVKSNLVEMELPQETGTKKKAIGQGASELRVAADTVLKRKCIEIADALVASSLRGHIQSARFLFALADGQRAIVDAEVARQLSSLAIELAEEQQLFGDLTEETAETAIGDQQLEG